MRLLSLLGVFAVCAAANPNGNLDFSPVFTRMATGVKGGAVAVMPSQPVCSANANYTWTVVSPLNNTFLTMPNITVETSDSRYVNVSGFFINYNTGEMDSTYDPEKHFGTPPNITGEWGWPAWEKCPYPVPNAQFPRGYCAQEYATGFSTSMSKLLVTPSGHLIQAQGSYIYRLFDANKDGNITGSLPDERIQAVSADVYLYGMAYDNGFIYGAGEDKVYRWPWDDVKGEVSGAESDVRQLVVLNITTDQYYTRSLLFTKDGKLLISVSESVSQGEQQDDKYKARIVQYDVDNIPSTGYDYGLTYDSNVFAYGLRNTRGLNYDPKGHLWGVDQSQSSIFRNDLGGDLSALNPGDELNRIIQGGFYGYPYCFSEYFIPAPFGKGMNAQWVNSAFKSLGVTDDTCRNISMNVPPALTFPSKMGINDVIFVNHSSNLLNNNTELMNNTNLAAYSAFISFSSSSYSFGSPLVARVDFDQNDVVLKSWVPVFSFGGVWSSRSSWDYQPDSLAITSQGDLLISSPNTNSIIKLWYVGEPTLDVQPLYPL